VPDELRVAAVTATSILLALVATPVAIRVAVRTKFFDVPAGYKAHSAPTPYLGGAAALCAFTSSALLFAGDASRIAPITVGALVLWVVGTLDDRRGLSPVQRMLVEAAVGAFLWMNDLGWSVLAHDAADLALTILWIVAVVNAFNLMDNMDGAACAVAAASGTAVGLGALVQDDVVVATLALSVAGACAAFLHYNLARPARIFLGDGGSMPIGFVLGACTILTVSEGEIGPIALCAAVLLVGLPAFDTALVIVSRRARHVPVFAGGRDHVTHRLHARLGSPRAVALLLTLVQAGLGACALALIL